ncbi:protein NETWORKED 3A-like [Actinidia eriantha]|uniref:protein NETWORKED 3A-like n=1 Tax=Actinidia eriantha TaxID=165200 RepID=UPI00258862B9|nr:protein NETWORKED 3A-like [Actinidia eriantha]XP_057483707.1 protein NETWORKED 3A-like [Actinidia eriantha]XP_057483708.1 protein NETWORKED 3A-like [Actinidia eriantha]XP_057483709.1 protein NETWORKED 3A-like [Actinidia eriantha]
MAEEVKTKTAASNWWWFDSHNKKDTTPRRSPWLQSTLSELDEKTKDMLRIIEEDADSFAKRAEMYYKKRTELISMIEDFYRAHRLLAERYDQVKSDTGFRHITPWASPLSFPYRQEKSMMTSIDNKSYDSYSDTYDPMESGDSEVDDPEEEEEEEQIDEENEEEEGSSGVVNDEVMKLRGEIERLKEENKIQKEQLAEKDEEKREVIRQLSLAMDALRVENVKLRKCVAKESPKKSSPSEFNRLKGMFIRKLFNGSPKSQASVVAL